MNQNIRESEMFTIYDHTSRKKSNQCSKIFL